MYYRTSTTNSSGDDYVEMDGVIYIGFDQNGTGYSTQVAVAYEMIRNESSEKEKEPEPKPEPTYENTATRRPRTRLGVAAPPAELPFFTTGFL